MDYYGGSNNAPPPQRSSLQGSFPSHIAPDEQPRAWNPSSSSSSSPPSSAAPSLGYATPSMPYGSGPPPQYAPQPQGFPQPTPYASNAPASLYDADAYGNNAASQHAIRNRMNPATSPMARPSSSSSSSSSLYDSAPLPLPSLMSNPIAAAAFNAYGAQVQKQVNSLFLFLSLHKLKVYFRVSNSYVLHKLYVLFCPFMHKNWSRERVDGSTLASPAGSSPSSASSVAVDANGELIAFRPPIEDVNAPDLYIPSMAFFTYILLVSYTVASAASSSSSSYYPFSSSSAASNASPKAFDPETIGILTSSTLVLLLIEVGLTRLGLWFLQSESSVSSSPNSPIVSSSIPSILDLTAYLSYKFCHAIAILLLSLLFFSSSSSSSSALTLLYYLAILIIGSLQALFVMRTLNRLLKPALDFTLQNDGDRGRHKNVTLKANYFLLALGMLQIMVIAFLVKSAV